MGSSPRRERQEHLAALTPDELSAEWSRAKTRVLGLSGLADEIDLSKSLPKNREQIEELAAKYDLDGMSLRSFLTAILVAIDDYYLYWVKNVLAVRDGFCSKPKAEKFARTIRSILVQMNDAGLMARLQLGADTMWPGEIANTRQNWISPIEEPDAFIKSPAAFKLSVDWFLAVANCACFDANDYQRFGSGDAKAAAEILLTFYVKEIDPSAKFYKNENNFWDDSCNIKGSPRSAFDFVFHSARLIDNTISANHLKDFVLMLNVDAFAGRIPEYKAEVTRFEQRSRTLNENLAVLQAFQSKTRDL